MSDNVNHPSHYTSHPSGVEAIAITEHMNFCIGNAMKYLWRAGLKGDALEDLKKARWYVDREIQRLEKMAVQAAPVEPAAVSIAASGEETCDTCLHRTASRRTRPCLQCDGSNHWEHAAALRGCAACAHTSSDRLDLPCVACQGFDSWEPVPAVCETRS